MATDVGYTGSGFEYYQPRFWGLDPLFSAKAKLNIRDILTLPEYPNFSGVYCILNHPIINVHVVGDVVSISKRCKLIVYEVDDGTGVISCCQWRKTEDSEEGLVVPSLGDLVSVYGRISEFREERQIKVMSIIVETDPNVEPLHWLEIVNLKRSVYSKPFTLPPGVSASGSVPEAKKKGSLKARITEALLKHLGERHPFTLSELEKDEELKKKLLESLEDEGEEDSWSTAEFMQELSTVIVNLPQEGYVIPLTSSGRYELLIEKNHLFPVIVEYIRRKCSKSDLGVPENWIVQFIKEKAAYRQLPTWRILTAIERLVEKSEIYPVGPKQYKLVT